MNSPERPRTDEETQAKVPALALLMKLGWSSSPPSCLPEAARFRTRGHPGTCLARASGVASFPLSRPASRPIRERHRSGSEGNSFLLGSTKV